MKYIVFFLVNFICYPESQIQWDKNRKLEQSDFKGFVPYGAKFSASSWISLDLEVEGKSYGWRFHANAAFDCQKSWMIKKHASPQLIKHEQKHFDLIQVSALDFLFTLSKESDYSNVLSRYRFINDSISRHYKELQRQYDFDTKHGQESDKQRFWEVKIQVMLDSLSAKVPNGTFIDMVTNK